MPSQRANLVTIITLVVLFFSIYKFYEGFSSEIIYAKSTLDGRQYLVRNLDDKEQAADMLAELRAKLKQFVADINSKNPNNQDVMRLKIKFKPNNLTESDGNSKFTSYSVNKGQKIVFCIRERDENNRLTDMNTITFVALHELAHVMTKEVGHTQEFWRNFKFLLDFAVKNGYYKYHPYHQTPQKYCGTMITDTPLKIDQK